MSILALELFYIHIHYIALPQTAAETLAAGEKQAYPLFHVFLRILSTLPVSTASSEKLFYASETEILNEITDECRQIDRPALLNAHRDVTVSLKLLTVLRSQKKQLEFHTIKSKLRTVVDCKTVVCSYFRLDLAKTQ